MSRQYQLKIRKEYLLLIELGQKTAEVRLEDRWTQDIITDDVIEFWNPHAERVIRRRVFRVEVFTSFAEMYVGEEGEARAKKIHPDYSKLEQQRALEEIYSRAGPKTVLLFHLHPE